ncbi:MAG: prepilin-type N-terminal cleavage/methylation domain-containing protein [Opitutaceae bacterium]|jgi:prepilin-type N-terminal cleavage/methylation domain-containing protein/prepilin-type processing-associated H-X9-DG protein|nr:prepilin-type N-terminal cleavage/methylation domain-containing protein [Opitutaceae bacterium]
MKNKNPKHTAFTLIELLTVITIIGILAAIIIPVTGKVRSSAANAQCKTVLRNYGVAIQMYVNDNKDRLPGPCYAFVKRNVLSESGKHLFGYIAPYISLQSTTGMLPDNYLCSLLLKQAVNPAEPNISVYKLMGKVQTGPDENDKNYPFGHPIDDPIGHTYSFVINYNPPSRTKALIDVDYENGNGDGKRDVLPPKPVHGNYRNVLYLDWHVGTEPVTP